LYHNEALLQLDVLVGGAVELEPRNSPPAAPLLGQTYIVGSSPSGAWTGKAGMIAAYDSYGWRFLAAGEGCRLWIKSRGVQAQMIGGSWVVGTVSADRLAVAGQQVVGPRAAAIGEAAGGTTVDVEARAAIAAILGALRGHGLIDS
jgi:hypothetical protein